MRRSVPIIILLMLAATGVFIRAGFAAPHPPGVVITHYPASSGIYIGSPSLAILPDGKLVVSHDGFGPKHEFGRTYLLQSSNAGETWQSIAQVDGQGSSTLFVHEGNLYLLGLGKGSIAIRRSSDGGRTWTTPRDENTGELLKGGEYHTGPTPLLVHGGRIWRALEDVTSPGRWATDYRAFLMSAAVDRDLLKASSWAMTKPVPTKSGWLDGKFRGWLEGNAVASPAGEVVILLRVWYESAEGNRVAVVHPATSSDTAASATTEFIEFPGGAKKFTIRFDPVSRHYWSFTNFVPKKHRQGGQLHPGGNPESTRNTLTLVSSPDLRNWTIESVVLYHPDTAKHGFQYLDWQFDGADLVAVSRTSYDDDFGGAHDMHDANYLTFHRIKDFRSMLNSPVVDKWNLLDE